MSTSPGSITTKNVNAQQINPDSLIKKKKEDDNTTKEDEDK